MPEDKKRDGQSRITPGPLTRVRDDVEAQEDDRLQDEQILDAMIDQMNETTVRADRALDEALAFVNAADRRVLRMESAVIPMRAAGRENENLISRGQAKQITVEIEKLDGVREVLLDFSGVVEIGQGFADQLFRVFAKAHPGVALTPVNCSTPVRAMIERAMARAEEIAAEEPDPSIQRETKP